MEKLTVKDEVIDDAVSAVQVLQENELVSDDGIFFLGHSLGGTLAPRIAVNSDQVIRGFIIMAGMSRSLEDTILDQFTYIYSITGNSKEQIHDLDILKEKVERVKDPDLSLETPSEELPLNVPAAYWKDLNSNNPLEIVKKLDMPILVIQGGRDYQVTIEDFNGWKNALKDNSSVEFKLFEDLNHMFMVGKGKATPQEYMKEGHVATEVIETISSWIKKSWI